MKPRWILASCGISTALMTNPLAAHACAVCVTGVGDPTADAFNWSVLFLMAMPYLVVGSIGGGLFYTYRRKAKREQAQAADPLVHLAWHEKESGR